jgi:hypothetical protein
VLLWLLPVLLRLILTPQLPLLVRLYQLLLLTLMDPDVLLLLLFLLTVLLQLESKVNNYFSSRLTNYRIQTSFSPLSP